MDHQWRAPHPVQVNICPACSTSHYPFCPPHPNPIYPAVHNTPNIDQVQMQTHPLTYPNMIRDPFHNPYHRNYNSNVNCYNQYRIQRPSFVTDPVDANYNRSGNSSQSLHHGASSIQMGSEYSMSDRTSKRLKVDGTYPGSYATDASPNPSDPLCDENERRLKLIHDHGSGSNGLSLSGNNYDPKLHENPASQSSNGYHLNSHIDHSGRQTYGSVHTSPLSVESSGEKSYSNAFTRPRYNENIMENHSFSGHPPRPYAPGFPDQAKYGYSTAGHLGDSMPPAEFMPPSQGPASYRKFSAGSHYGVSQNGSHFQPKQEFNAQPGPPLSASSPLPLPLGAPGQWTTRPNHSSGPARMSSSLFPADLSSSTPTDLSYPSHLLVPPYPHTSQAFHSSGGPYQQEPQGPQTALQLCGHGQPFPSKHNVSDKPKIVDASSLLKPPNRDKRPDCFVIILRGLPGSGKSYLAKMLRDLEVEHGGNAPRIHSMDDYFMTEVEKVEENESLKSSARGKKPAVKKVLEYCYEPEMEEAYRASMLKAFKKTLDEGAFTFIIVDDRNLRVADFAQFWATAKRSGYEVYLLQTTYKDPAGCTARNIHGFTRDDIEKMAGIWEEAPPLYLQLDAKSLFHGDDLKESSIQEVDMDMDDEDTDGGSSKPEDCKHEQPTSEVSGRIEYDDSSKNEKRWDVEADNPDDEAKDLRRSKWSGDLDEDNTEDSAVVKGKSSALSGLLQSYRKEGKSVHWGDQTANVGFSIGAAKKKHVASLIIGPGSGYTLSSNPLLGEEARSSAGSSGDTRKHSVFVERLKAEQESFKAVFDRRRHRIGGLGAEEE